VLHLALRGTEWREVIENNQEVVECIYKNLGERTEGLHFIIYMISLFIGYNVYTMIDSLESALSAGFFFVWCDMFLQ
jgi:hypothetical protein